MLENNLPADAPEAPEEKFILQAIEEIFSPCMDELNADDYMTTEAVMVEIVNKIPFAPERYDVYQALLTLGFKSTKVLGVTTWLIKRV